MLVLVLVLVLATVLMNSHRLRVLLLGDTHLGLDHALRPRVHRRRRGPELFANYQRALRPALRGEVDLVVHGGDLFNRSRPPLPLAQMALEPLLRVADRVPVFVVPGNHERSRIPHPLLSRHPNLHIFHEPRTVPPDQTRLPLAVSGFPFARQVDGAAFSRLVEQTGWRRHDAPARLLCIHQAVEGATVGAHDFVFRRGRDVIRGRDLPGDFAAVLSGHIHRWQVLTEDLSGHALAAPVLYPGSTDRTSFAERLEDKGYMLLELESGRLARWTTVPLPTRPMLNVTVPPGPDLAGELRRCFAALPADAIVRLQPEGAVPPAARSVLGGPGLRAVAPAGMNVSVAGRRMWNREQGTGN